MKILFLIILLFIAGCSDAPKARAVLQASGYTNITITGYSVLGCSDSDTFSTGFKAISPNGSKVKGVVCSGWLKGATIRFQ